MESVVSRLPNVPWTRRAAGASGPGGWNRIHLQVTNLEAEVERLRAAGWASGG